LNPLGDTHDREHLPIDSNRLIQSSGLAAETVLPIPVPQNCDRIPRALPVIFRRDSTPDQRLDPEQREVATRHCHYRSADRLGAISDIRAEQTEPRDSGQRLGLLLQGSKDPVIEDGILVAGVVGRSVAALQIRWGGHDDKLVRVLDRQRSKHYLVQQRENAGICADAQRQRKHHHERDDGGSRQGAHCESYLTH
jgi:hypothetical protein